MNYAEWSQYYWNLQQQHSQAAEREAERVRERETARVQWLARWNRALRNPVAFVECVEQRTAGALDRSRTYKRHIALQRHYLRLSNGAANQAYLHGQDLLALDGEAGELW